MALGETGTTVDLLADPRPRPSRNGNGSPSKSMVLSNIPLEELDSLRPHLEPIDLPQYFILHEQSGETSHIYFPQDGMVSLVVLANDGRSVEVSVVGREGVVGLPRLGGMTKAPYRAISQIQGTAQRVRFDVLEGLLPAMPGLQSAFSRYTLLQGLQMAQTAACNRLHEINQRLARWLLMCQDRVNRDKLLLTHEFLAQMLGAGRPTVSLAAGMLERAGLIHNVRGAINILDRPRLEQNACECYAVMRDYDAGLAIDSAA
jgi:CRP-like cAMP-binding protein